MKKLQIPCNQKSSGTTIKAFRITASTKQSINVYANSKLIYDYTVMSDVLDIKKREYVQYTIQDKLNICMKNIKNCVGGFSIGFWVRPVEFNEVFTLVSVNNQLKLYSKTINHYR